MVFVQSSCFMKIVIVSDAWKPQVNGVVTTLIKTGEQLEQLGHSVLFITPDKFVTIPCPTYSSIRLSMLPYRGAAGMLARFNPDAIHIATEGPLGHAVRAYCRNNSVPFTTAYHTQFPEYLRLRFPIPTSISYHYLRGFHRPASRTMVSTKTLQKMLTEKGFTNVAIWSRGVDTKLFQPQARLRINVPRPLAMYMGRVAVEKNIEAFLQLDLPGSKYVVGDGPDLQRLRERYPRVTFLGEKRGAELAGYVAAADVFVFPSLTDTFGLVLLEAMACGVPVAAYPVAGPVDVVKQGETGVLHADLRTAVMGALSLDRAKCVRYAKQFSWRRCTESFLKLLKPIPASQPAR